MSDFVLRLRHLCPLFDTLFVAREMRYVPLQADLSNLEEELANGSRRRDFSYTNEDPKDVRFALPRSHDSASTGPSSMRKAASNVSWI